MVLYRIILTPLAEELQAADPGPLSPFYADDAAFDNLARRSAHFLNLLGDYPQSVPLFINRFKRCALRRAKLSNAASSA